LLSLTACGFEPLYSQKNQTAHAALNNISIDDIRGELGKQFSNQLEDLITTKYQGQQPKYKLKLDIDKRIDHYLIDKDSITTRYNVVLVSNYEVISLDDNKVIDKGQVSSTNGYSASYSEFATYISEEDATNSSIKELAEEIRRRLIMLFIS
jgi:hypothetical protein